MKIDSIAAKVLDLAVEIQQIPAPTFDETRRGEFVLSKFRTAGLEEPQIDAVGNVYARLAGKSPGKPIVLSAHLDTVFPAGTNLQIRRDPDSVSGPGIGDNALGVAGLFGLLWLLESSAPLHRDLWLAANVGEEGLGNLCGMQAVVDRFQAQPTAYIVLEGMAYGSVYHRGLGVQRFRITATTGGGHSWINFGSPSAIHELARLVARIDAIEVPESPRCSYNVGVIQGGTSVNTIAAQATMELDLRSESGAALEELRQTVMTMVQDMNQTGSPGVDFQVTQIGQRPMGEIPADHPLTRLACHILEKQGITPRTDIGSTDANVPLSRGYPAICIGLTTGRGAHTTEEMIDTPPLVKGLAQLLKLVSGVDQMGE
jgi:tripeptide aminopeptidase